MEKQFAEPKDGNFVSLFYDGQQVNHLVKVYRATGERVYLDHAIIMADYIMADLYRRKSNTRELKAWLASHCWIGIGRGYGGIAEACMEIARTPNLHELKALDSSEITADFQEWTYLKRAQRWTRDLQQIINFRKSNDKYDHGKWYQSDKEINYQGGPAATNRYLYYCHFMLATASAAEALDPKGSARWVADVRLTIDEVMAYFSEPSSTRPSSARPAGITCSGAKNTRPL